MMNGAAPLLLPDAAVPAAAPPPPVEGGTLATLDEALPSRDTLLRSEFLHPLTPVAREQHARLIAEFGRREPDARRWWPWGGVR